MNQLNQPASQQDTVAQATPESTAQRRHSIGWSMVGAVAVAFFAVVSPTEQPSIVLLGGFVALAALLAAGVGLLLLLSGLGRRLSPRVRRTLWIVAVLLPILLLMLQSTGQLTVRDCITLGALFALGFFYIGRLRRPASAPGASRNIR